MEVNSISKFTSITPETNIKKVSNTINSTDKKINNKISIDKENESKEKLNKSTSVGNNELSEEEKQKVKELKKIDAKVKAHEQAHVAAGGDLVKGRVNYQYQVGPDNKKYAVGGEVSIDIAPVPGDPEATIRKMQKVKRAALAPADPSPQDRSIATKASQIEAKARIELREESSHKTEKNFNKIKDNSVNKLIEEYSKQNSYSNEYGFAAYTRGVLDKKA